MYEKQCAMHTLYDCFNNNNINNNNNIWFKHQYLEKNISNQKCYTSLKFKSVT